MARRNRKHGWRATASAALAAGALLAAAPPAQAKTLKYVVTSFTYTAGGSVNAGRATSNCVLGQSALWSGNSASTVNYPAEDLAALNVGGGQLNLKSRKGLIQVGGAPTGNDVYGQHQLAEGCSMGVPLYGAATTHVNSFSSALLAQGRIKPAGKKYLEIGWTFSQIGVGGGNWVPDFNHVEPFRFPSIADCATIVSLKRMKKKGTAVPFVCSAAASSFPNTDQYDASTTAGGGFGLERKKDK